MENQHHQKLAHSSSDQHGRVHVCHKCGWPYPNPHPSAKHRRAHKRICGKVEGYKLFDSEGSTHSNVSDDEHLSDEDHNTPGPKVLEASSDEKGSRGNLELLSRSEDEVFSDAAAEFLDHGVGGRAQGRVEAAAESATKILKTESNATQSIESGPVAETVKPLGSLSTENILSQHSETPETTSDRSVYAPELAGSSASFKSNPILSSVSDHRAEGLAVLLDGDRNPSADVFRPIHSETLQVLHENEKTNTTDDVASNSLKSAKQQTNLEEQKETYLDNILQDAEISTSKLEGETAWAVSKSDETLEVKPESSPPTPEHYILQLQKEHSDGFLLKTSKSDVFPDVESGEHANAPTDTVEKTVDIAGVNYVKSRNLVEKKGEVHENLHVLSVSDDIHKVDDPETMLKDFKDHKVMKLDQPASLEYEQATEKEEDAQGPVLEESSKSYLGEGSLVSSSDKHVLEDSVQLDQRSSVRVIKDVLVEGDVDRSKLEVQTTGKQGCNGVGAAEDVVTPHIDKAFSVVSPDGQGSHDACSVTLEGNLSQSFDNTVSNADLVIASANVGTDPETDLVSESGYEKAGKSDLTGDYKSKEAREVYYAENPVTDAESARSGSEVQVNPAINLQERDDAGDYVKTESKKNDITGNDDAVSPVKDETGVDNESSPAKECLSEQPEVAPGSAKGHSEVKINQGTNLWEVDIAGSFEKVGKTDVIIGDSCEAVARPVEDGSGVDNKSSPTKESFSKHPALSPVSAKDRSEVKINQGSNLWEVDIAGSLEKVGKTDVIMGDSCDAVARPVKDGTGVDNKSSPAKESFSEQPVDAPGSAKDRSEVEINQGSNLWEVDIAGSFEKVGKTDVIRGDSCDAVTRPVKDETGIDNINSPAKESCSEQPVVAPELAKNCSEVEISPVISLQEGDTAGSFEKVGTKKDEIMGDSCGAATLHAMDNTGVHNDDSPSKESSSEHPVIISEWAKSLAEYVVTPVVMWATGETGVDTSNSPSKEIFSEHPVVTPESAKTVYDIKNNLETKKVKKTGDAYDGAAHHMKDEAGVDNGDGRSMESYSKHAVVTTGSAMNLSEVEINLETNLQGGTIGSVEKAEIKKDKITEDACDAANRPAKDEAGVNNDNSPSIESCLEHFLVTPESAKNLSEVEINLENKLQEGDTAGNFNNVETEKDEIARVAYNAAAPHAKGEAGGDASNSPSKNFFMFTPESAEYVHDITINPETNLGEGDIAGNFEKLETKKDVKTGDTFDGAACHVKDEAAVDIDNSPAESGSEHALVTPESAKISGVAIKPQAIIHEEDTVDSVEKVKTKKYEITADACGDVACDVKDGTGVDDKTSPSKEIFSVQTVDAPESALSEVEINGETDLREGEAAGNFSKSKTKNDNITGDAYDAADCHGKGESGFEKGKSHSKESCSEQPTVTPESAKNLSEVQINPESSIGEGDTADNFDKTQIKKIDVTGDAPNFAVCHAKDGTGVGNNINLSKEDFSAHPVFTPESAKTLAEVEINSETHVWEGDGAGNLDKVETRKEGIPGDARDIPAGHVKDELGVDNSVGPTKESLTEHPIVTHESARNLSDLKVNPDTNLWEEETAGKFEKVETKENKIAVSCAAAAGHLEGEIGINKSVGPPKKSGSGNAAVAPESANHSSQVNVNPATKSQEGNNVLDPKKNKSEKLVEHGTESQESSVEENLKTQLKTTPESAIHPQEFQTVAEDVVIGSTDSALDSSRSGDDIVREIHIEAMDHQLAENDKVQVGKEPTLSPLDAKSSIQSSTAVEGNSARELDAASGLGSESFQTTARELDGQQFGDSTHGMSVDSSSRTDSLENNWGSVSVVSLQSDAQPATDADIVIPIESHAVIRERTNPKESKPSSERQYPDKSDMFEPPSFMTLVEPGGENDQKGTAPEIPTGQSSQQAKSSNLQAGWFPSITHVVNESPGRKKNEEMIAKVTNWSTSKPHTPLKNLLGEASVDTRAKSPKRKDLAPSPQKDDKEASTVMPDPELSSDQAANRDIGNEWNSPARYPTEIKREKRKPKGRPYWAQFMCCSSVH